MFCPQSGAAKVLILSKPTFEIGMLLLERRSVLRLKNMDMESLQNTMMWMIFWLQFPFLNSLMLIVDECTYIQFCMPGKILTFFGQSGFSGTVDNSATPVDSQPPRCSMGANASHRQNSYRNQKLDEDVWLLSPDSN